jgi:hypothetical protein
VTDLLWSPDGTHLVADKTLIDVGTGDQVTLPGDAHSAAWSRDSSLLAEGAGTGLALIHADGRALAQVDICRP